MRLYFTPDGWAGGELRQLEGLGRLVVGFNGFLLSFISFKSFISFHGRTLRHCDVVWRLWWWDFVSSAKTWCKVFRQRVVKGRHCYNCSWWLQQYQRFWLFTSLFSCWLKKVLQERSLSGNGRVGANLQTEWFVDLQCRTTRSKLASLEHLLV